MKGFNRQNQLFALCGLNCGLCPMFLSKHCPGCGGGEGNQSCKIARCSLEHGGVEYCFQCDEYPCSKYDHIEDYDVFITGRNQKRVRLGLWRGKVHILPQPPKTGHPDFIQFYIRPHKLNLLFSFCICPSLPSMTGSRCPAKVPSSMVLTPVIFLDQTNVALDASGLTISWKRKDGMGAESALSAGEAVSGGILTVSQNKLSASSSGMITYICYISYYDSETKNTVNISSDILTRW